MRLLIQDVSKTYRDRGGQSVEAATYFKPTRASVHAPGRVARVVTHVRRLARRHGMDPNLAGRFLEKEGMAMGDVELVPLQALPALNEALAARRVDAVATAEPFVSRLEASRAGVAIVRTGLAPLLRRRAGEEERARLRGGRRHHREVHRRQPRPHPQGLSLPGRRRAPHAGRRRPPDGVVARPQAHQGADRREGHRGRARFAREALRSLP